MPTYTRGQQSGMDRVLMPDTNSSTPGSSVGITEHQRRGFVGLLIRPNAYRFHFMRTQDVLAPINSDLYGYPLDPDRSYGPSGLSVANGRWELRRAIVLRGERKKPDKNFRSITLYIDALTQAPLYLITRKRDEQVKEVGIFMGKFTGDDPLAPKWDGSGKDFGWILPVAETLFVAGEEGWIRDGEVPHRHDRHDLFVVILKGHGGMRLGNDEQPVGQGSILYVPRGAPHAFRNLLGQPALAYAVYAPAFDGKDRVVVK